MRVGRCEAEQDLYLTLGLSSQATPAEIRRAHKRLARLYHPDLLAFDSEARAAAERRMKQINHAASLLLNPQARSVYDGLRSGHRPSAPARPAAPPAPAWYDAPPTPPSRHERPAPPSIFDHLAQMAVARRGQTSIPSSLIAFAVFTTLLTALLAPASSESAPVASPAYKIRKEPERVTMWAR